MTINYIVKGFDKNFYNFDAVVVPIDEKRDKSEQEVHVFRPYYLDDFRYDLMEIVKGLSLSAFKPDRVKAVKSEKTGIYYIFVMIHYLGEPHTSTRGIASEISLDKSYIFCCEKMIKCINRLDVKNILIHPVFNQVNFNFRAYPDMDIDFLAKALKSNIDRFSKKNIYIGVQDSYKRNRKAKRAIHYMEKGLITYEECAQIYVEEQMESLLSYTNNLIRNAEIETRYTEKSLAEQFCEDMNNSSLFFYEYINRYSGTATELARKANIDKSTVSTIKSHKYNGRSRNVVISLAIALDLTVDDRKRFINSAGFSYPTTKQDRFIEQQLRKKKYNSVTDFNNDISGEHPEFVIGGRSSGGYNKD
ncbi:MAG: hypothetical protein K2L10_09190 [Ruminococcus sp.]|nr:hypothetical protein [Ruminococcus sp.]